MVRRSIRIRVVRLRVFLNNLMVRIPVLPPIFYDLVRVADLNALFRTIMPIRLMCVVMVLSNISSLPVVQVAVAASFGALAVGVPYLLLLRYELVHHILLLLQVSYPLLRNLPPHDLRPGRRSNQFGMDGIQLFIVRPRLVYPQRRNIDCFAVLIARRLVVPRIGLLRVVVSSGPE